MKRINISTDKHPDTFAIVDDEDFEELNQWKWFRDKQGYAARDVGGRKNKKRILMHRLINKTPDGFYTDHKNRIKLDNKKCNLKTVTSSENQFNRKIAKNNKSGHTGIYWYKNRWVAGIKKNYEDIYLGRHKTLKEAIFARKEGERKYAKI